jgi:hypothetical protein
MIRIVYMMDNKKQVEQNVYFLLEKMQWFISKWNSKYILWSTNIRLKIGLRILYM